MALRGMRSGGHAGRQSPPRRALALSLLLSKLPRPSAAAREAASTSARPTVDPTRRCAERRQSLGAATHKNGLHVPEYVTVPQPSPATCWPKPRSSHHRPDLPNSPPRPLDNGDSRMFPCRPFGCGIDAPHLKRSSTSAVRLHGVDGNTTNGEEAEEENKHSAVRPPTIKRRGRPLSFSFQETTTHEWLPTRSPF